MVEKVNEESKYKLTQNGHTNAWKHFSVRPSTGAANPRKCNADFCVYDKAHNDYLYTTAWVKKLIDVFSNVDQVKSVIKREPVEN